MQILFLSDFHSVGEIPNVQPDLVILLGDIDYYEIRKIDAYYTCPKLGVLGNHDGPDYFHGTSIIDLHKKIVEIEGMVFAGYEGSPTYNRRKYLQYTEEEVSYFTRELKQVDFFIAHSNPSLQEEHLFDDAHRGFKEFTNYIQRKSPAYFVHGHIHESKEYFLGETKVISVYPYHQLFLNS